jgi:uncharacterized protein
MHARLKLVLSACFAVPAGAAATPTFDCTKTTVDSIADLVCRDEALTALDNTLAAVYAWAAEKAHHERAPTLKAEQGRWIKALDECSKSADRRACVEEAFRRRIAEVQARYRLVPANGPVVYVCNGEPRNEISATFFLTDPPTLLAQRGGTVAVMYQEPSASGARYVGRNESFWEHQGEASIQWGTAAPTMRCFRKPQEAR